MQRAIIYPDSLLFRAGKQTLTCFNLRFVSKMTGLALTKLFWYHAFQVGVHIFVGQTNCLQKSEGFQFTPQVASSMARTTKRHHGFASARPKSMRLSSASVQSLFRQVWFCVIFFFAISIVNLVLPRKSARLCLWCFLRGHPICLSPWTLHAEVEAEWRKRYRERCRKYEKNWRWQTASSRNNT